MFLVKKMYFCFEYNTKIMPNRRAYNWIALFSSNFLGVFNDNLLKNSIIFFTISWSFPSWLNQSQLISIVSGALIFPYLILSPYAGNLTVSISKIKLFRWFKFAEIIVMAIAALSFVIQNIYLAIVSVLLMGILSCLYSPSKYSLIHDIGGDKKAAFGSGVFETMAFLGVLLGTVLAALLSDGYSIIILLFAFIITSVFGYLATSLIKVAELPTENHKQSNNPVLFIKQSYKSTKAFAGVNAAVVGSALFWLIGAMLQMNLVIHSKYVYGATNTQTGIVMSIAALAIALGCTLAAKLAGESTGQKMILPALVCMIVFLIILTFVQLHFYLFIACVFGFAMAGGFFQVPNLAIIQNSNAGRRMGDLFAYLNLTTFVFILIGTISFSIITQLTNENSYAVFGVILIICAIALVAFFNFYQKNKFTK